jgi:hypothetical protein
MNLEGLDSFLKKVDDVGKQNLTHKIQSNRTKIIHV